MPHILLVDDEPAQRQTLRKSLESRGMKVAEASGVTEADERFDFTEFDVVITELQLPGEAGTELIRLAAPVPVIVMTNYASLRSAVESMKRGAVDYLAKPCSTEDLVGVVNEAISGHPQSHAHTSNPEEKPQANFFEGSCPELRVLDRRLHKVAATESTVLIQGETGTGKEVMARRVHQHSQRANRRVVTVNCAAIPDTLIESELFGYEKGAFTGANSNRVGLIEAADGGTLFLDEIGELPLAAQARLLRFIQEGEIRRIGSVTSKRVDVRLICATHRDLAVLSQRNEFRQDLFYRINVLRIEIPPLRERGADIVDMAEWFCRNLTQRTGNNYRRLSDRALDAIRRYSWPGNVRELEHAIERGLVMAEGVEIEAADLGISYHQAQPLKSVDSVAKKTEHPVSTPENSAEEAPSEELSLEEYFQRFVLEHQDAMSETELAQKLGISRKCLWERRQRFDLPRKKVARKKPA